MDAVTLRPGVIVAVDRNVAYVMSPDSSIAAIETVNGNELWRSTAAEKPIALRGDVLIGQVNAAGPPNALTIAALDTRQGGALIAAETTMLPANVDATIDETPKTRFALASPDDGTTLVFQSSRRVPRGAPPLEDDPLSPDDLPLSPTLEPLGQPETTLGALRLDLAGGDLSLRPADLEPTPEALDTLAPTVAAEAILDGVPEPQFASADGRHVMHSQRVGDDRVWDKYRWTIYERDTGAELGAFRTFQSFSPFVVVDRRVIFETAPFARQDQGDIVEGPLMLRGIDLATGEEVWEQAIRDTEFRGPFPP